MCALATFPIGLGAVGTTGEFYRAMPECSYKSAAVIGFLQQLRGAMPGKLLLIWRWAPIRRRRAVREYLSQGAMSPAETMLCPGVEPVWRGRGWGSQNLVELWNAVCADLASRGMYLLPRWNVCRANLRCCKPVPGRPLCLVTRSRISDP